MSKSDEFIDSLVDFLGDEVDTDDVVSKLKSELNLIQFNPSDQLVSLVNVIDEEIDPENVVEEGEEEDEEDEDETEGYWGEDDDDEEEEK